MAENVKGGLFEPQVSRLTRARAAGDVNARRLHEKGDTDPLDADDIVTGNIPLIVKGNVDEIEFETIVHLQELTKEIAESIKCRFSNDLEGLIPQAMKVFNNQDWLVELDEDDTEDCASEDDRFERWKDNNRINARGILRPVWMLLNESCRAHLEFEEVCHGFVEFSIAIANIGSSASLGKNVFCNLIVYIKHYRVGK